MSEWVTQSHLKGLPAHCPASFGPIFDLVIPQGSSEGRHPYVQGCPSRQREEEEEGHVETKPVYHASGHSAERQLSQHLQSRQETVVGRLQREVVRGGSARRRDSKSGRGTQRVGEIKNIEHIIKNIIKSPCK